MKTEKNRLMLVLILVIVVLAGVIVYAFLLKPTLNGYTVKLQSDGVKYAVYAIMQQASQCQQVPLQNPFGNETMNLIWVDCLQQAQQTSQTVPTG
jgi:hypothetical protein